MNSQLLVFVVFLVLARHVPVTYGISSHASDAYSQHKRNTERIADQVRQKGGKKGARETLTKEVEGAVLAEAHT